MPVFGHHSNAAVDLDLDGTPDFNSVAPRRLQTFLGDLGQAESTDDVWTLMLGLCRDLGQTYLSYAFTKVSDYSQIEFNLRSNAPDSWKSWLSAQVAEQELKAVATHDAQMLGLSAVGIEFMDDYRQRGPLSPSFQDFLHRSAAIGWKSGLLVPLRTVRRMEYGGMTIAGDLSRSDFLDFTRESGWTFSVASLQAHLAYREFMFREEADSYDLSPRHLDFLRQSARGFEIKEIAHNWQRSQQYVTRVRREVCDRLGVTSKMAVMAKAAQLDILIDHDIRDLESVSGDWD